MYNLRFKILNLTCAACVKLSDSALQDISGVSGAVIDPATGVAEITSSRQVAWEEIVGALRGVDKEAVKIE